MKPHHDHLPWDTKTCSPCVLGKDRSLLLNSRKYKMSLSWFRYKSFSNVQISHCSLIFCSTGTRGLQSSHTLHRKLQFTIVNQIVQSRYAAKKRVRNTWKICVVKHLSHREITVFCALSYTQSEALTQLWLLKSLQFNCIIGICLCALAILQ